MTSAITSGVSLQPFHVNLFLGEWEIRLFSGQAGGFGDHFHPSISHCIFMCIVGSENMLLIFFSSEISVTRSFRNRYKISHNTKSKIWRQLCDVILPAKNVKIGKIGIMKYYRMTSSILLRKFRVIALKLHKLFQI